MKMLRHFALAAMLIGTATPLPTSGAEPLSVLLQKGIFAE